MSQLLEIIVALLAMLTFAVSNTLFRKVESSASAIQINTFRTIIGSLTFIIVTGILGELPKLLLFPLDLHLLLLCSFIFGQLLGDSAYFQCQRMIGTTLALTLSMTFPFFTFILLLLLNRQVSPNFYMAGLLIAVGIIILSHEIKEDLTTNACTTSNTQQQFINKKMFLAIGTGLFAAFSWALAIILTEYALAAITALTHSPNTSSILGNAIRFPYIAIILVFITYRTQTVNPRIWDRNTWLWLTIASIIGTSLGAFFYTEATRLAGSALTSLLATTSPIFAAPITWIMNHEKITIRSMIGVLITIIGIIIVILA